MAATLSALKGLGVKDKSIMLYWGIKNVHERLPDTAPEKALTSLGLTYSTASVSPEAATEGRRCIAEMLAAPLTDTPERSVMAATLSSLKGLGVKDKSIMLYWGIKNVHDRLPDGAPEKALTSLGLAYSTSSMSQEAVSQARESVAAALSVPLNGSAVKRLMGVTAESVNGMAGLNDRNNCLYYGFNAVKNLPGATAEQKKIAAKAIAYSTSNHSPGDVLTKRLEYLQELLSAKDPLDELKEMAESLAGPPADDAVVVDEDGKYVSIDGVRIEIKQ